MFNTVLSIIGSSAFAGVFTWMFHLGSRVTVLETSEPAFKELMASKLDEVNRRLGRIEVGMNGYLSKD